jgi:hypothetical protein
MTDFRATLAPYLGKEVVLAGKISEFSTCKKPAGKYNQRLETRETVLLVDLSFEDGRSDCDHMWFDRTGRIEAKDGEEGDRVKIKGIVKSYEYDDSSGRTNLTLKSVTVLEVIKEPVDDSPLERYEGPPIFG